MASRGFRVGDVIDGRYTVSGILGQGGMGVVLAAEHREMGRRVAIKLLLDARDQEFLGRFRREAEILAQLDSAHVCQVLDMGSLESGAPYLVMEHIEGDTLSHELRERGPMETDAAVRILLQVIEALGEAHALGVVHRDLKPSNLMITRGPDGKPHVKVLDFGIAKAQFSGDRPLTAQGTVLGTPRFMAPEQLRNTSDVDGRADIWSLGAILFEMLSGRRAFEGADVPSVILAVLSETPPPLEQLRPDVPSSIAALVRACLDRNPDGRPTTVGELASRLRAGSRATSASHDVAADHVAAVQLTPLQLAAPPTAPAVHAPLGTVHALPTKSPRSKRALTALLSVALAATVIAGALSFAHFAGAGPDERTTSSSDDDDDDDDDDDERQNRAKKPKRPPKAHPRNLPEPAASPSVDYFANPAAALTHLETVTAGIDPTAKLVRITVGRHTVAITTQDASEMFTVDQLDPKGERKQLTHAPPDLGKLGEHLPMPIPEMRRLDLAAILTAAKLRASGDCERVQEVRIARFGLPSLPPPTNVTVILRGTSTPCVATYDLAGTERSYAREETVF